MGVVTMFAGMLVIMGLLICAMRVLVSVMMVVCMVMFVRVFMSMRHPVVMRVLMRMSVAVNVLMRVIVFDYCLGLPNKEFRLSVARSFRDAKINVGVNMMFATGWTGQTTENFATTVVYAPGAVGLGVMDWFPQIQSVKWWAQREPHLPLRQADCPVGVCAKSCVDGP